MTVSPPPLARWVSIVGHPFVLIVLLTAVATTKLQGGKDAASAVGFVIAAAILPIGLFMYSQVKTGRWGTVDASRRSERPALFALMLALLVVLGLFLRGLPNLALLSSGLIAAAAILVVAFVLNTWIKTSMHMAFASWVAVTLLVIALPLGLALLIALPLLGWSRLAMRRHTLLEVLVGVVLGATVGWLGIMR